MLHYIISNHKGHRQTIANDAATIIHYESWDMKNLLYIYHHVFDVESPPFGFPLAMNESRSQQSTCLEEVQAGLAIIISILDKGINLISS